MKMPLMNDYVASLFLAESPWLFGFITRPANVWMARTMAEAFAMPRFLREQNARELRRRPPPVRRPHNDK